MILLKGLFHRTRSDLIRRLCSTQNHFDIIIAGGGMVGNALACTLGKNSKLKNKRILLLEATKEFVWNPSPTYGNRVVALNPHTYKLFNRIGIWKHIEETRYGVIKSLQVWDALSDSMITFSNDDLSEPVAYTVENDIVMAAVDHEAKKLENVSFIYGAKIKETELQNEHTSISKVILEDGGAYTCDLLLGCEGVKSKVREAMKFQYLSWDYGQMGVVATLHLEDTPENDIAWQRFLPTGPIAFLPLKENISSLVWSTNILHARSLLNLPEDQFVDAVNDAMWKVYQKNSLVVETMKLFDGVMKSLNFPSNAVRQLPPHVKHIESGSRAAFPLGFGHATQYVSPGVALLGDAAHRIHPMAGQGVNLGFGDIDALDSVLSSAVYNGSKVGDINYLKDYEMQRQRHNVPTMLAVEGLHRLYTTDFPPFVLLRSLGLQFTNVAEPIKRSIISQGAA